jgi:hypothetical protein
MKQVCINCHLPRAELSCGLCAADVCRDCVCRLAPEAFELRAEKPAELSHLSYCPGCYEETVTPALEAYEAMLETAKEVGYWAKNYRGSIPILEKGREVVAVEGARDRDEALLRLGFKAAELGFNGLVQGELKGHKVRRGGDPRGYQSMEWSGHALPVRVDSARLDELD